MKTKEKQNVEINSNRGVAETQGNERGKDLTTRMCRPL